MLTADVIANMLNRHVENQALNPTYSLNLKCLGWITDMKGFREFHQYEAYIDSSMRQLYYIYNLMRRVSAGVDFVNLQGPYRVAMNDTRNDILAIHNLVRGRNSVEAANRFRALTATLNEFSNHIAFLNFY